MILSNYEFYTQCFKKVVEGEKFYNVLNKDIKNFQAEANEKKDAQAIIGSCIRHYLFFYYTLKHKFKINNEDLIYVVLYVLNDYYFTRRYKKEDLLEVGEYYFSSFVKNYKGISKDTRLFKKILNACDELPYPGELKNVIKTSLAFSDADQEHDYLRRLYNNLIGNLDNTDLTQLYSDGFTVREIEKLTGESKSTVARKLNKEVWLNE